LLHAKNVTLKLIPTDIEYISVRDKLPIGEIAVRKKKLFIHFQLHVI
jgi:hypothetical protein